MLPRPLVVSWHGTAGASMWMAAVVRVEGRYLWTRTRTPQHIWGPAVPRCGLATGFQELLLGAVLILGTFDAWLENALWESFGSKSGVTYALAKGGGQ